MGLFEGHKRRLPLPPPYGNRNTGLGACHNERLIAEAGVAAKGKRFIRCCDWENAGLQSQRPTPLPDEAHSSSYRERREGLFLSNYLASFWSSGALSINISSFCHTQCKNVSLHHLGQWGRRPSAPWLSTVIFSSSPSLL